MCHRQNTLASQSQTTYAGTPTFRAYVTKQTEPSAFSGETSVSEVFPSNNRPIFHCPSAGGICQHRLGSIYTGQHTEAGKVQRRAARYVTSRHRNTSSVSDMLQRSLEARRKYARLCMMFKIDRELVAIQKEEDSYNQ